MIENNDLRQTKYKNKYTNNAHVSHNVWFKTII